MLSQLEGDLCQTWDKTFLGLIWNSSDGRGSACQWAPSTLCTMHTKCHLLFLFGSVCSQALGCQCRPAAVSEHPTKPVTVPAWRGSSAYNIFHKSRNCGKGSKALEDTGHEFLYTGVSESKMGCCISPPHCCTWNYWICEFWAPQVYKEVCKIKSQIKCPGSQVHSESGFA